MDHRKLSGDLENPENYKLREPIINKDLRKLIYDKAKTD